MALNRSHLLAVHELLDRFSSHALRSRMVPVQFRLGQVDNSFKFGGGWAEDEKFFHQARPT